LEADDLPLWYNSAETFLYPSIFEGFGLPVLEAMACGTPVIVSDASSLPEVVGESGFKIPPRDIQAWADALRTAYHDATWRESAGQHGLNETRRYNWALTAQTVVNTYRQALKRHDNPR
jgi:alpha-1,3-rhamnosyl/mannosyltransferase